MKRILSMLLVVMLLVGCLSTVASAESTRELKVEVKLEGTFASLGGKFTVEGGKVTNVSGSGISYGKNGNIGYYAQDEKATNKNGATVTVKFEVPADSCGKTFNVKFVQDSGMKTLYDENGEISGYEPAKVSGSKSITADHGWSEWKVTEHAKDCQHNDVKSRACSYCGETETKKGDIGPHVPKSGWKHNSENHWHECEFGCDVELEKDKHTWGDWETTKKATTTSEGSKHRFCDVCEREQTKSIPKLKEDIDDVPDMGDTTPYGTYNAMIAMFVVVALGTVALVYKRKAVK